MFEAQVTYYLNKYLGTYLEGIDSKSLKISIYSGNVELRDLQLKPDALADLDLPLRVKAGLLGSLTLKVPWNALGKQPVEVIMDRLYVLVAAKDKGDEEEGEEKKEEEEGEGEAKGEGGERARPEAAAGGGGAESPGPTATPGHPPTSAGDPGRNPSPGDGDVPAAPPAAGGRELILTAEDVERAFQTSKNLRVSRTEHDWVQELEARKEAADKSAKGGGGGGLFSAAGGGMLKAVIDTVIGNLQFSVTNVHVRYEDAVADPRTPLALGVTLARVSASTVDEAGREAFVTRNPLAALRKALVLERAAVYWDVDARGWDPNERGPGAGEARRSAAAPPPAAVPVGLASLLDSDAPLTTASLAPEPRAPRGPRSAADVAAAGFRAGVAGTAAGKATAAGAVTAGKAATAGAAAPAVAGAEASVGDASPWRVLSRAEWDSWFLPGIHSRRKRTAVSGDGDGATAPEKGVPASNSSSSSFSSSSCDSEDLFAGASASAASSDEGEPGAAAPPREGARGDAMALAPPARRSDRHQREPRDPSRHRSYVLLPVDGRATYTRLAVGSGLGLGGGSATGAASTAAPSAASEPSVALGFALESVACRLTRRQYESVQSLAASLQAAVARSEGARFRPDVRPRDGPSAKAWWKYAVICVQRQRTARALTWRETVRFVNLRSRYVTLYARHLLSKKGQAGPLPQADLHTLIQADRGLPEETVLMFRRLGHAEAEAELQRRRERSAAAGKKDEGAKGGGGGWLGWLRGGGGAAAAATPPPPKVPAGAAPAGAPPPAARGASGPSGEGPEGGGDALPPPEPARDATVATTPIPAVAAQPSGSDEGRADFMPEEIARLVDVVADQEKALSLGTASPDTLLIALRVTVASASATLFDQGRGRRDGHLGRRRHHRRPRPVAMGALRGIELGLEKYPRMVKASVALGALALRTPAGPLLQSEGGAEAEAAGPGGAARGDGDVPAAAAAAAAPAVAVALTQYPLDSRFDYLLDADVRPSYICYQASAVDPVLRFFGLGEDGAEGAPEGEPTAEGDGAGTPRASPGEVDGPASPVAAVVAPKPILPQTPAIPGLASPFAPSRSGVAGDAPGQLDRARAAAHDYATSALSSRPRVSLRISLDAPKVAVLASWVEPADGRASRPAATSPSATRDPGSPAPPSTDPLVLSPFKRAAELDPETHPPLSTTPRPEAWPVPRPGRAPVVTVHAALVLDLGRFELASLDRVARAQAVAAGLIPADEDPAVAARLDPDAVPEAFLFTGSDVAAYVADGPFSWDAFRHSELFGSRTRGGSGAPEGGSPTAAAVAAAPHEPTRRHHRRRRSSAGGRGKHQRRRGPARDRAGAAPPRAPLAPLLERCGLRCGIELAPRDAGKAQAVAAEAAAALGLPEPRLHPKVRVTPHVPSLGLHVSAARIRTLLRVGQAALPAAFAGTGEAATLGPDRRELEARSEAAGPAAVLTWSGLGRATAGWTPRRAVVVDGRVLLYSEEVDGALAPAPGAGADADPSPSFSDPFALPVGEVALGPAVTVLHLPRHGPASFRARPHAVAVLPPGRGAAAAAAGGALLVLAFANAAEASRWWGALLRCQRAASGAATDRTPLAVETLARGAPAEGGAGGEDGEGAQGDSGPEGGSPRGPASPPATPSASAGGGDEFVDAPRPSAPPSETPTAPLSFEVSAALGELAIFASGRVPRVWWPPAEAEAPGTLARVAARPTFAPSSYPQLPGETALVVVRARGGTARVELGDEGTRLGTALAALEVEDVLVGPRHAAHRWIARSAGASGGDGTPETGAAAPGESSPRAGDGPGEVRTVLAPASAKATSPFARAPSGPPEAVFETAAPPPLDVAGGAEPSTAVFPEPSGGSLEDASLFFDATDSIAALTPTGSEEGSPSRSPTRAGRGVATAPFGRPPHEPGAGEAGAPDAPAPAATPREPDPFAAPGSPAGGDLAEFALVIPRRGSPADAGVDVELAARLATLHFFVNRPTVAALMTLGVDVGQAFAAGGAGAEADGEPGDRGGDDPGAGGEGAPASPLPSPALPEGVTTGADAAEAGAEPAPAATPSAPSRTGSEASLGTREPRPPRGGGGPGPASASQTGTSAAATWGGKPRTVFCLRASMEHLGVTLNYEGADGGELSRATMEQTEFGLGIDSRGVLALSFELGNIQFFDATLPEGHPYRRAAGLRPEADESLVSLRYAMYPRGSATAEELAAAGRKGGGLEGAAGAPSSLRAAESASSAVSPVPDDVSWTHVSARLSQLQLVFLYRMVQQHLDYIRGLLALRADDWDAVVAGDGEVAPATLASRPSGASEGGAPRGGAPPAPPATPAAGAAHRAASSSLATPAAPVGPAPPPPPQAAAEPLVLVLDVQLAAPVITVPLHGRSAEALEIDLGDAHLGSAVVVASPDDGGEDAGPDAASGRAAAERPASAGRTLALGPPRGGGGEPATAARAPAAARVLLEKALGVASGVAVRRVRGPRRGPGLVTRQEGGWRVRWLRPLIPEARGDRPSFDVAVELPRLGATVSDHDYARGLAIVTSNLSEAPDKPPAVIWLEAHLDALAEAKLAAQRAVQEPAARPTPADAEVEPDEAAALGETRSRASTAGVPVAAGRGAGAAAAGRPGGHSGAAAEPGLADPHAAPTTVRVTLSLPFAELELHRHLEGLAHPRPLARMSLGGLDVGFRMTEAGAQRLDLCLPRIEAVDLRPGVPKGYNVVLSSANKASFLTFGWSAWPGGQKHAVEALLQKPLLVAEFSFALAMARFVVPAFTFAHSSPMPFASADVRMPADGRYEARDDLWLSPSCRLLADRPGVYEYDYSGLAVGRTGDAPGDESALALAAAPQAGSPNRPRALVLPPPELLPDELPLIQLGEGCVLRLRHVLIINAASLPRVLQLSSGSRLIADPADGVVGIDGDEARQFLQGLAEPREGGPESARAAVQAAASGPAPLGGPPALARSSTSGPATSLVGRTSTQGGEDSFEQAAPPPPPGPPLEVDVAFRAVGLSVQLAQLDGAAGDGSRGGQPGGGRAAAAEGVRLLAAHLDLAAVASIRGAVQEGSVDVSALHVEMRHVGASGTGEGESDERKASGAGSGDVAAMPDEARSPAPAAPARRRLGGRVESVILEPCGLSLGFRVDSTSGAAATDVRLATSDASITLSPDAVAATASLASTLLEPLRQPAPDAPLLACTTYTRIWTGDAADAGILGDSAGDGGRGAAPPAAPSSPTALRARQSTDARVRGASGAIAAWRPAAGAPGYLPLGDVITAGDLHPTFEVLLLAVNSGLGAYPISYDLVWVSPRGDLAAYRPVPPPGYLALGDVLSHDATGGAASSATDPEGARATAGPAVLAPPPPALDAVLCVHEAALVGARLGSRFCLAGAAGSGRAVASRAAPAGPSARAPAPERRSIDPGAPPAVTFHCVDGACATFFATTDAPWPAPRPGPSPLPLAPLDLRFPVSFTPAALVADGAATLEITDGSGGGGGDGGLPPRGGRRRRRTRGDDDDDGGDEGPSRVPLSASTPRAGPPRPPATPRADVQWAVPPPTPRTASSGPPPPAPRPVGARLTLTASPRALFERFASSAREAASNEGSRTLSPTIVDFRRIWSDRASPLAGPAGLSLWRPVTPAGYASLGDCLSRGYDPPLSGAIVRDSPIDDDPATCRPLLALPKGFELVWLDAAAREDERLSLWRPVAPDGYVCVGCVAAVGPGRPPARCVRAIRVDAAVRSPIHRSPLAQVPSRAIARGAAGAAGGERERSAQREHDSWGLSAWVTDERFGTFAAAVGDSRRPAGIFATNLPGWREEDDAGGDGASGDVAAASSADEPSSARRSCSGGSAAGRATGGGDGGGGGGGATNVVAHVGTVRVLLRDTFRSPLLELELSGLSAGASGPAPGVLQTYLGFTLAASAYSAPARFWEPVLEPWAAILRVDRNSSPRPAHGLEPGTHVSLKSHSDTVVATVSAGAAALLLGASGDWLAALGGADDADGGVAAASPAAQDAAGEQARATRAALRSSVLFQNAAGVDLSVELDTPAGSQAYEAPAGRVSRVQAPGREAAPRAFRSATGPDRSAPQDGGAAPEAAPRALVLLDLRGAVLSRHHPGARLFAVARLSSDAAAAAAGGAAGAPGSAAALRDPPARTRALEPEPGGLVRWEERLIVALPAGPAASGVASVRVSVVDAAAAGGRGREVASATLELPLSALAEREEFPYELRLEAVPSAAAGRGDGAPAASPPELSAGRLVGSARVQRVRSRAAAALAVAGRPTTGTFDLGTERGAIDAKGRDAGGGLVGRRFLSLASDPDLWAVLPEEGGGKGRRGPGEAAAAAADASARVSVHPILLGSHGLALERAVAHGTRRELVRGLCVVENATDINVEVGILGGGVAAAAATAAAAAIAPGRPSPLTGAPNPASPPAPRLTAVPTAEEEVLESERWTALEGWSYANLVGADGGRFQHNLDGSASFPDPAAPPGWAWDGPWVLDRPAQADADGWVYGPAIPEVPFPPTPGSGKPSASDVVRRRRWVRFRIRGGERGGADGAGAPGASAAAPAAPVSRPSSYLEAPLPPGGEPCVVSLGTAAPGARVPLPLGWDLGDARLAIRPAPHERGGQASYAWSDAAGAGEGGRALPPAGCLSLSSLSDHGTWLARCAVADARAGGDDPEGPEAALGTWQAADAERPTCPAWFSVACERSLLGFPEGGPEEPLEDWKLEVRAPLEVRNALPLRGSALVWEADAASGALASREALELAPGATAKVHSADPRREVSFTFYPDGYDWAEDMPVRVTRDLGAIERAARGGVEGASQGAARRSPPSSLAASFTKLAFGGGGAGGATGVPGGAGPSGSAQAAVRRALEDPLPRGFRLVRPGSSLATEVFVSRRLSAWGPSDLGGWLADEDAAIAAGVPLRVSLHAPLWIVNATRLAIDAASVLPPGGSSSSSAPPTGTGHEPSVGARLVVTEPGGLGRPASPQPAPPGSLVRTVAPASLELLSPPDTGEAPESRAAAAAAAAGGRAGGAATAPERAVRLRVPGSGWTPPLAPVRPDGDGDGRRDSRPGAATSVGASDPSAQRLLVRARCPEDGLTHELVVTWEVAPWASSWILRIEPRIVLSNRTPVDLELLLTDVAAERGSGGAGPAHATPRGARPANEELALDALAVDVFSEPGGSAWGPAAVPGAGGGGGTSVRGALPPPAPRPLPLARPHASLEVRGPAAEVCDPEAAAAHASDDPGSFTIGRSSSSQSLGSAALPARWRRARPGLLAGAGPLSRLDGDRVDPGWTRIAPVPAGAVAVPLSAAALAALTWAALREERRGEGGEVPSPSLAPLSPSRQVGLWSRPVRLRARDGAVSVAVPVAGDRAVALLRISFRERHAGALHVVVESAAADAPFVVANRRWSSASFRQLGVPQAPRAALPALSAAGWAWQATPLGPGGVPRGGGGVGPERDPRGLLELAVGEGGKPRALALDVEAEDGGSPIPSGWDPRAPGGAAERDMAAGDEPGPSGAQRSAASRGAASRSDPQRSRPSRSGPSGIALLTPSSSSSSLAPLTMGSATASAGSAVAAVSGLSAMGGAPPAEQLPGGGALLPGGEDGPSRALVAYADAGTMGVAGMNGIPGGPGGAPLGRGGADRVLTLVAVDLRGRRGGAGGEGAQLVANPTPPIAGAVPVHASGVQQAAKQAAGGAGESADVTLSLELPCVEISVVDTVPAELFVVTLTGLEARAVRGRGPAGTHMGVRVRLHRLQVDDQTPGSPFPVVLAATKAAQGSDLPILSFAASRVVGDATRSRALFPALAVRLPHSVQLAVSEAALWRARALGVALAAAAAAASAAASSPGGGAAGGPAPGAAGADTPGAGSPSADDKAAADLPVRVRLLAVSDLAAEVSFQGEPSSRPRDVSGSAAAVVLDLANFSAAPLTLRGFEFEDASGLKSSILERCVGIISRQAFALGLALVRNFGLMGSASRVLGALSAGVARLTEEGGAGAGAPGRDGGGGAAASGGPPRAPPPQAGGRGREPRTIEDVGDGILEGAGAFGASVARGFRGLVERPRAGAREAGAAGAISGLGRGLLGALASPVSGVLGALSATAEGFDATFSRGKHQSVVQQRRRLPRVVDGRGRILPLIRDGTFDQARCEELGQALMQSTLRAAAAGGGPSAARTLAAQRASRGGDGPGASGGSSASPPRAPSASLALAPPDPSSFVARLPSLDPSYEDHFVLPDDRVAILTDRGIALVLAPGFAQLDGAAEVGAILVGGVAPGSLLWAVAWSDVLALELRWSRSAGRDPDRVVVHRVGVPGSKEIESLAHAARCFPDTPQASQIKLVAQRLAARYSGGTYFGGAGDADDDAWPAAPPSPYDLGTAPGPRGAAPPTRAGTPGAARAPRPRPRLSSRSPAPPPLPRDKAPLSLPCLEYRHRWNTNPTKTPVVSFWTPVPPPGYKPLGDVLTVDTEPPAAPVPCVRDDAAYPPAAGGGGLAAAERPATARPTDYALIWRHNGRRAVTMWQPVPPPGYVACGAVVLGAPRRPRPDAVVCVRADLAEPARTFDSPVWAFDPSLAPGARGGPLQDAQGPPADAPRPAAHHPEAWRVSVWQSDTRAGCFLAVRAIARPPPEATRRAAFLEKRRGGSQTDEAGA